MDVKQALKQAKEALEIAKAKRLLGVTSATTPAPKKAGLSAESMKHLQKWGVRSFEKLMEVNTADTKFGYISVNDREAVKALKESVDIAVLSAKIFGKKVSETKHYQETLSYQLKAFGIDSGDEGFEWIPTMVADSYIDEYNLPRKVSGLFQEIKMPSNPYKWPVLTDGAIARIVGEVSAISPSQVFKTDKTITFDAVKLQSFYELPEELNEDSAVDMIKVIRQELMEGQEKALEIGILEGDTSVTHQHTNTQLPGGAGAPAANSPERLFDGIRVRLLAATGASEDAGGNQLNELHLSAARAKMGKFGVNPAELALICEPKGYNQMLQLDDVRTLEQYGAQATVISGELAKYEGMPVIVSEYLRADTDTTGVNGASAPANIKGTILIVNRKRWFVGVRRAVQILVEKNRTQYDVLDMVSFSRKAFQAVLKADGSNYASESSGAIVFNIGL